MFPFKYVYFLLFLVGLTKISQEKIKDPNISPQATSNFFLKGLFGFFTTFGF